MKVHDREKIKVATQKELTAHCERTHRDIIPMKEVPQGKNIRLRLGNEEEKKYPNERGYEVESTIKYTWWTTRIWSESLRKLFTGGKLVLNVLTTDSFLGLPMKH